VIEERMVELLVELHVGLDRQGPGDRGATERALRMCEGLPAAPRIADIGCGAGAQTLDLARATSGEIIAVDLFDDFLATLRAKAEAQGLGARLRTMTAYMSDLPFAEGQFDLLWSKGAIYIMGFDNGLKSWRPFVRPGGWLCVTELSFVRDDAPQDCRNHWAEFYPGMRESKVNIAAARELGWEVVEQFTLTDTAWTRDYYGPLRERLGPFREKYADDPDALTVAEMTENEMRLFDRYSQHCGYVFYVMRRAD
jgi:ubiquinone/menaquinone biosynthesis C-methylase UbiE